MNGSSYFKGGYIYVDDNGSYNGCKRAVDEFRADRSITEPVHLICNNPKVGGHCEAVWWRKPQ